MKEETMRNIFLVVKQEIVTTLSKRSFWIMTFLFPAFIIALNIGTQIVAGNAIEGNDTMFGFGEGEAPRPILPLPR